jgi:FkbM family methyltransferase
MTPERGERIGVLLWVPDRAMVAGYLSLARELVEAGHRIAVAMGEAIDPSAFPRALVQGLDVFFPSPTELSKLTDFQVFVSRDEHLHLAPPGARRVCLFHSLSEEPPGVYSFPDFIRRKSAIVAEADYLMLARVDDAGLHAGAVRSCTDGVFPAGMLAGRCRFFQAVPFGYPKIDHLARLRRPLSGPPRAVYSPTNTTMAESRLREQGVRIMAALLDAVPDLTVVFRPFPNAANRAVARDVLAALPDRRRVVLDEAADNVASSLDAAFLVTDQSSSALTYSLAMLRPHVTVDFDGPGGGESEARPLGCHVRSPAALAAAAVEALRPDNGWEERIRAVRKAYVYNPEAAGRTLLRMLPAIAAGEPLPEALAVPLRPAPEPADGAAAVRHLLALDRAGYCRAGYAVSRYLLGRFPGDAAVAAAATHMQARREFLEGRIESARAAEDAALALAPDVTEYLRGEAEALDRLGRFGEAAASRILAIAREAADGADRGGLARLAAGLDGIAGAVKERADAGSGEAGEALLRIALAALRFRMALAARAAGDPVVARRTVAEARADLPDCGRLGRAGAWLAVCVDPGARPPDEFPRRAVVPFAGKLTYVDVGARFGARFMFPHELCARDFTRFLDYFRIVGIEPDPEGARTLSDRYDRVLTVALYDRTAEMPLHITRKLGNSSLLEPRVGFLRSVWQGPERYDPAAFPPGHPDGYEVTAVKTVAVTRLDAALDEPADWIKLDVQGVEQEVLEGAGALLDGATVLVLELSAIEQYAGQKTFEATYRYLAERGFSLAKTDFRLRKPYECNAVFLKNLSRLRSDREMWSVALALHVMGIDREVRVLQNHLEAAGRGDLRGRIAAALEESA